MCKIVNNTFFITFQKKAILRNVIWIPIYLKCKRVSYLGCVASFTYKYNYCISYILRLPQFKIVGENENTSDLIANMDKPSLKPSQAFSERSDRADASNRIPALRKYTVLLTYSCLVKPSENRMCANCSHTLGSRIFHDFCSFN